MTHLGDLQMVTDTAPPSQRDSQGGSYGHENEIVCDFTQLNPNLQVVTPFIRQDQRRVCF